MRAEFHREWIRAHPTMLLFVFVWLCLCTMSFSITIPAFHNPPGITTLQNEHRRTTSPNFVAYRSPQILTDVCQICPTFSCPTCIKDSPNVWVAVKCIMDNAADPENAGTGCAS